MKTLEEIEQYALKNPTAYQGFLDSHNYYFASSPEQEIWAEERVKRGTLKPIKSLDSRFTWEGFYIPASFKFEDLNKIMKANYISCYFGIDDFFGSYSI